MADNGALYDRKLYMQNEKTDCVSTYREKNVLNFNKYLFMCQSNIY